MGIFSDYSFQDSLLGTFVHRIDYLQKDLNNDLEKAGISNLSYACILDQHIEVSYISDEITKLGHNPTDFYNQRISFLDLIVAKDQDKYKNAISALRELSDQQIFLSYRLLTKDGNEVVVEDKLTIYSTPKGKLIHGLINTDKSFSQAQFFAKLFEVIPSKLLVIDDEGQIIFANQAFKNSFKCLENSNSKKISQFFPGFNADDGANYQFKVNCRAKEKSVFISTTRIPSGQGSKYYLLKIDEITSNKSSSQIIKENNMKFNLAQKVAKIGIWEYNLDNKTITGSGEAAKLIGLEKRDYSLPLEEFIGTIGKEQQGEFRSKLERLLANHEDLDGVFDVIRPSDGISIKVQIKAFYNLGHSDKVILGTVQDITTLKETENELKVRNFELNNFVYKVSHDVRAPLVSIEGLINLMRLGQDQDSSTHYLDLVHGSIKKLDLFIRNVLSHSKNLNTDLNISRLDFNKIIEWAFAELYYLDGIDKVKLQVKIEGGPFYSDPERVNVIFKNLISNSVQYRYPGRKKPTLKIIIKEEEDRIEIAFVDNGEGIDKQIQPKIFNMFYRGNEKSKGSGIGLYIVKQTLEKIHGSISIESEVYKGTTVRISLKNYRPDFSI